MPYNGKGRGGDADGVLEHFKVGENLYYGRPGESRGPVTFPWPIQGRWIPGPALDSDRGRESMFLPGQWIPAFAGKTIWRRE